MIPIKPTYERFGGEPKYSPDNIVTIGNTHITTSVRANWDLRFPNVAEYRLVILETARCYDSPFKLGPELAWKDFSGLRLIVCAL